MSLLQNPLMLLKLLIDLVKQGFGLQVPMTDAMSLLGWNEYDLTPPITVVPPGPYSIVVALETLACT
jgi:hypothetical protein